MIRNNAVLLNENVVGLYTDRELPGMLETLSDYYNVEIADFVVTKNYYPDFSTVN